MGTFRLISGEGEITLSFLIIHRFFFFSLLWRYYMCDFCQGRGAKARSSLDDCLLEVINDPGSFVCLTFPSSQSNFLLLVVW